MSGAICKSGTLVARLPIYPGRRFSRRNGIHFAQALADCAYTARIYIANIKYSGNPAPYSAGGVVNAVGEGLGFLLHGQLLGSTLDKWPTRAYRGP